MKRFELMTLLVLIVSAAATPTCSADEQPASAADLVNQANAEAAAEREAQLRKALSDVQAIKGQPRMKAVAPRAGDWAPGWSASLEEEEEGRIVNGVRTQLYPSTGALIKAALGSADHAESWCTGTLVGCETFLTANHCVRGDRTPEHYFVYLQHGGILKVKAISPQHPQYRFPNADLAVLKVAPVEGITPTGLYAGPAIPGGTAGRIVGFGRTGGGNQDYGIKRRGNVRTAACTRPETSIVCWDFLDPLGPPGSNSNTCNADSGGPLLVSQQGGGSRLLAGVTSGGTEDSCLTGDASYDVDVRQYIDWIKGHAGEDLGKTTCGTLPVFGSDDVRFNGGSELVNPGQTKTFQLKVPAGTEMLRVTLNGEDREEAAGQSNVDLTVSPPQGAACVQGGPSQYAFCQFAKPEAGTWAMRVTQAGGVAGRFQLSATIFKSP